MRSRSDGLDSIQGRPDRIPHPEGLAGRSARNIGAAPTQTPPRLLSLIRVTLGWVILFWYNVCMKLLSNFEKFFVVGLVILSVFFLFFRLGAPVLDDWDEGIYSNIAGEIASGGSWLHLQLQGTQWLEKEPLVFWFMALAIKIFGFTTFALRFSSALLSIFIAPLFYLLTLRTISQARPARRSFSEAGFSLLLTLLFFFSPALWHAHMLRAGDLNAIWLVTFLAALAAYVYLRDSKHYWLIGVCVALNFLTRGFVGILLLGIILSAEFIRSYFKQDRWTVRRFVITLAIALLPWLAWHLTQYLGNPTEYIRIYWQEQFFSRIYLPLQNHSGDWLFYFRFLKAKLGVWYLMIFGLSIVFAVYKTIWSRCSASVLWCFSALVFIIVLQTMRTKLNWYVLPLMPILYLLAGQMFWQIYQKIKNRRIVAAVFLLVLMVHLGVLVHSRVTALRGLSSNPTLPVSGPWYEGKVLPAYYWYSHFTSSTRP